MSDALMPPREVRCPHCDRTFLPPGSPTPNPPPELNPERQLSLLDVRKYLGGRSDRFVRELIYRGKLKASKAGDHGHWRVRVGDLEAYLQEREQQWSREDAPLRVPEQERKP